MPRDKKKLTYIEMEDHVIDWALNQVEGLRCAVDRINDDVSVPESEVSLIFAGIAEQFAELVDLIKPLRHDEKDTLCWMECFVEKWRVVDTEN